MILVIPSNKIAVFSSFVKGNIRYVGSIYKTKLIWHQRFVFLSDWHSYGFEISGLYTKEQKWHRVNPQLFLQIPPLQVNQHHTMKIRNTFLTHLNQMCLMESMSALIKGNTLHVSIILGIETKLCLLYFVQCLIMTVTMGRERFSFI